MPQLRPALTSLSARYRWLITLTIGGRVVRLSTDGPVTITGNDGTAYEFAGGLGAANYARSLDLWASSPAPRSMSFEALLDFDIAQQVARGVALFAAEAELAQWYEGQTWERRRVVLRGLVSEPAYGVQGDPFSFAIREDPGADLALVPPSSWAVDLNTWAEAGTTGPDPGIVGAVYPLVIGAPGRAVGVGTTSASLSDVVPATPALLVRRDTAGTATANHDILICGGKAPATRVTIYNATDPGKTFSTTTLIKGADVLGQPVTYVNPDTSGNSPDEGDQLYTIWDPTAGGGTQNPFGTGALRGAGDVIRWALASSTVRYDHSRLSELSILNSLNIDTFINAPSSPWAWVLSEVIPLLPVTVGTGPDGLFVAPWLATAATADQAVEHLEEGRNCTREGSAVYTSPDQVYNDLTLRYAPNIEAGSFALRQTLNGEHWTATDSSVSPGFWCRRSRAIFGTRPLSLESSAIYDPATAGAVLTHLARRYSHPRREIVYTLPRSLDWLRPGDVVTLTDAGLHLAAVPGVVGSVAYSANDLSCQVVLFEPLVFAQ